MTGLPAALPLAFSAGGALVATVVDGVGVRDSSQSSNVASRESSDAATVGDAWSLAAALEVLDAVGPTDAHKGAVGLSGTAADAVGNSDLLAAVGELVREVSDPTGTADAATALAELARVLVNGAGLVDASVGAGRVLLVVADAGGLADTLVASNAVAHNRLVVEASALADVLLQAVPFLRSRVDAVGVDDSRVGSLARDLVEAVPGGDGLAYDLSEAFVAAFTDRAGVADARAVSRVMARSRTDAVGAVDSRTLGGAHARSPVDRAGVADDVLVGGLLTKLIADRAGVADMRTLILPGELFLTVTDRAGFSDAVAWVLPVQRPGAARAVVVVVASGSGRVTALAQASATVGEG